MTVTPKYQLFHSPLLYPCMQAELEKLLAAPSATAAVPSTKSPYAKIVAENERIRRELKKVLLEN